MAGRSRLLALALSAVLLLVGSVALANAGGRAGEGHGQHAATSKKQNKKKRRHVRKPCRATKQGAVYRSQGYKGRCQPPKTDLAPPFPSTTLSDAGRNPRLIIDPAGTAHIVWSEEGGSGPDTLHYCRILRGSSSCNNPASTRSIFPVQPDTIGNSPAFNDDSSGPQVLAVGQDLALITRRYPNVVPKPIGGTSDTNTYLWVSDDGGNSLTGPAQVGTAQPSGGATVFGDPGSPRIGLISDTETGGTFFQSISPATYTDVRANLGAGGSDRAYSGSVSTVGGRPVAAFSDLSNQIFIRQWNGIGSPNDASQWTQTVTTGTDPHLAAGPVGSFMVDRPGINGPPQIVKLNGTTPEAPVAVETSQDAGPYDLFADPGGALHLAWVDQSVSTPSSLLERSSTDGRNFTPTRKLAIAGSQIGVARIAAAADGGGFATYTAGASSQGYGKVEVAPFGSQEATGQPGLGGQPGGGAAPGTVVKCQEIGYDAVQILASQGCLLSASDQNAVKVSEGPIKINGLEIIPDAGARILLGTRDRTIDTTGKVTVQIRASGGPIVLFHGELHLKLPSGSDGVHLATFDTSKFPVDLKGFPVQGDIDIILHKDSVEIPIALKMPKVFGGLTGNMTLRTSNSTGLQVSSMHFHVGNLLLGPVVLKDLDIDWDGGSSWSGSGTILIGGAVISAHLEFTSGSFSQGSVEITPVPFPGVPLFTDVFLNKISGGLELDPFAIEAGGTVGARPIAPPDSYIFDIRSNLRISTKPVFAVDVTGQGRLVGFPVSESHLHGDADGYFSVCSQSRIDLAHIISAGTEISGFFDANSGQFGASAGFDGCVGEPPLGICAGFEGLASSKGIAGCAGRWVGFGYTWGGSAELLGPPCDTSPYEVKASASGARTSAAGDLSFSLPAGLPSAGVRLTGSGGPPAVVMISPSGQRLAPVPVSQNGASTAPASAAVSGDQTHIGLFKPEKGLWKVEVQPGPSVTQLAVARGLSPPRVSAKVHKAGKHGSRKRVIRYRSTSRNGLVVRFFELVKGGGHLIGTTRKGRGKVTFSAGDGPAGRRPIIAQVEQDDLPRLNRTVAHYKAPGPIRPRKVRSLKVKQKGKNYVARWRRSGGASTYAVLVKVSDGRNFLKIVKSNRAKLGGITKRDRIKVTVVGRSTAGRTGKAAAVKAGGPKKHKKKKKRRKHR